MAISPELLCIFMFASAFTLLLAGFPVAFTLAGTGVIFAYIGFFLGIFDLSFLTAFPQRIFATMTNETLVAVPLFVFMGVMLERSKIAEDLLQDMGKLFGTLPGGLAISVCIVGALLAASTGIVGATVVTMGLLSLPTMLRRGYSPRLATGTIAASGTLGQIIPPSIVLVLLGDQLSVAYQNAQFAMGIFAPETVSVNDLFAGALLPGLALVGFYILYQIGYVFLYPDRAPPMPAEEVRDLHERGVVRTLFGSLVAPVLLIVAVLGSILGGLASPTEAAAVGAIGATMLAAYRMDARRGRPILLGAVSLAALFAVTSAFDLRVQRQTVSTGEWVAFALAVLFSLGLALGVLAALWRTFVERTETGERVLASVCRSTMVVSAMVFMIIIGAAMFSLVFRGLRGDIWVEELLAGLPGGTVGAVLAVMAVMFVMGFFLDFLEIVFIVVPIVAPILLQMEVSEGVLMSPIWLGIMMAVNLQTSFLTPPFGFALFYLRGVAPDGVRTMDIYRGIVPFVLIQLLSLALLWSFPAIATWLPALLYGR
jgi:tripartite ATP-independent transporter DctM subunit